MKRKDFYIEYYNRTNRFFSDKTIWLKKNYIEAQRKGQHYFSKPERKVNIAIQYLILLVCWIPMCFDRELWRVIPIALILFLLMQLITDFSVVKIELLYYIYRKNDVYCSLLYDIFLDSLPDFLDKLNHLTNKKVTGYIFMGGGKFYGKYLAVCRNRSNNIILKFKTNRVIIKINEKKFVIKDTLSSKEDLIAEISKAINENAS